MRLTSNPIPEAESTEALYYPFVCPLTQRIMNGKHRFICLWPCGCIMSEDGLRTSAGLGSKARPEGDKTPCPLCSTMFHHAALFEHTPNIDADVVWLGLSEETQSALREQLQARRKRKPKANGTYDSAKRMRSSETNRPSLNSTAPGAYAAEQVRAAQAHAALKKV